MEITATSTKQTKELAQQLAANLESGNIIALYGELGSGKTTFTSYLVKALGFSSRVQSPTFIIVRNYTGHMGDIKIIHHVDLYRLTSLEEVKDIGIEELMNEKNSITVIEWPEIMEELLPQDTIRIYFHYLDDNERKIIFSE